MCPGISDDYIDNSLMEFIFGLLSCHDGNNVSTDAFPQYVPYYGVLN